MEWENWCTKDRYEYFILNLSIEVGFINVDSVNTWSTESIIFLVVYEMNVVFNLMSYQIHTQHAEKNGNKMLFVVVYIYVFACSFLLLFCSLSYAGEDGWSW
jgi:hypothetical protein